MKEQDIVKGIKRCGDENSENYTVNLKKLIFSCSEDDIGKGFYKIIDNGTYSELVRFGAYYALFTYYRRFEMRFDLFKLYDKYGSKFNVYKLDSVIQSQYYKFKYIEKKNSDLRHNLLKLSIKYGQKAIEDLGSVNIGVYNNYAELVLSGIDNDGAYVQQFIDKAIMYVETAIDIRENQRLQKPYSRYYCSIARLLSYKCNYEQSLYYIQKAISCEGTEDKDALIRIGQYNNFQLEIKMKELIDKSNTQIESVNKSSKKVMNRVNNMEKRYIELLAFFSSVIALIITSVNIAVNVDGFYQISGLLIIMAAILLIAFVILKFLIKFHEDGREICRIICAFVLALLLLGFGLYIGKYC